MTTMNPEQLWQAALGELELTLSKANFTTWFKHTFISELDEGRVTVSVPNTFTKAWLEKRYHSAILKALQNILNTSIRELNYRVESRSTKQSSAGLTDGVSATVGTTVADVSGATTEAQAQPVSTTQNVTNEMGLRLQYTFDTFIVGKGNELAHAAAQAVADSPGKKYNPLFIYGGVGLGKTHLLQAIGHKMLQRDPTVSVLYATCEQFTNDYISAVRAGQAKEFKDRYRRVNLLIIDDIQFIANKEGTQEEFFHTFNALYQHGSQVVISSDRPPKTIPTLEKRLESRLEMGMVVDTSAPDFETRVAILRAKCTERQCNLSDEILTTISNTITSNVRELEGALNKIIAYHEFKRLEPTVETVNEILTSFTVNQAKKSVTTKQVIATVCSYFDVRLEDILGKSRERKLAFPRQIVMYLMRNEMKSSYPTIGNEIGNRDHTTAMHACEKITRLMESDEKLQQDITFIKERLYQS